MIVCTSDVLSVPAVLVGCTGGAVVPGVGTAPLSQAQPTQPPGIAPNGKSEPKPYRLLRYRFGLTPA